MRFLLVAYDFPPIPSPQALRWAYLARELAVGGNEVHVLAPDVLGYGAGRLPELPASVVVHRCWPGPFMGRLVARKRQYYRDHPDAQRQEQEPPSTRPATGAGAVKAAPALNWKGRLFHRINALLGWVLYPDMRAEWGPSARKALDRLLDEVAPDIVISSHEPPVSIPLGLHAKKKGFTWVADLGDPVLAPYTPRRWRARAFRLERELCAKADLVTLTSDSALATLRARHGLPVERAMVLTQGFDHRFASQSGATTAIAFDPDRLELLYTGSFYAFRRPEVLLDAVLATSGARLTIATINPPPSLVALAESHPDSIRLLGFIGHLDALALQRRCDLLVNIANADPVQVPGKIYEYLGAAAPILHIGDNPADSAASLLSEFGAGWSVAGDSGEIAAQLARLRDAKCATGALARPGSAVGRIESSFSWQSLAASLQAASARIAPARSP
ncbi:glycosyltransferase [Montanilutibacter psychrotolerans]|uniref:Glycosyltransferase subfamily 4-like N-terminal domain-containing protein n=1 Tax=Montanilutibacter psychrotolerans TaxID=1327343 RepID=A0A3M8SZN9_9GAMM|nr:glycosyltransferase [Lysobacter psychrotolerans]RNF84360.1 hypothetical protein EER27_08235 [Lysobacter psychrotolerans]